MHYFPASGLSARPIQSILHAYSLLKNRLINSKTFAVTPAMRRQPRNPRQPRTVNAKHQDIKHQDHANQKPFLETAIVMITTTIVSAAGMVAIVAESTGKNTSSATVKSASVRTLFLQKKRRKVVMA